MAEPFKRLVKLAARAFYDDFTTKGDNRPRTGRSDNRGLGVVVLDALTRRQWVREEDLARSLKVHSKQLRRILRFFEEEKLTVKGAKISSAVVAAICDGTQIAKEADEKMKIHTHSYCCLDYAQIYDVVRYRLHRMKKKLKDELEGRNTIQAYICPNCSRRYSAFDALQLVSPNDDYFHCENCDGELVAESEKIAAEEMGDGEDSSRKRRHEKLKDMLQKMENERFACPEFGTLQAWEARVKATHVATTGDASLADLSKPFQGLVYGGTPMACLGETKVEVTISGSDAREEGAEPDAATPTKVLPPWMIRQGMSLSRDQRGEAAPMNTSPALLDQKQKDGKEGTESLQEEYVTAFYEAYAKMQMELAEAAKKKAEEPEVSQPLIPVLSSEVAAGTSCRQVGVKSKREELEWEEAPPIGFSGELPRADRSRVRADVSEEDEDEELVWEEG
ncbi:unnamed protein product [Spirodela intermedia]|uniref:HTH TFE/IIEalpha-type domain-containing protein n=1 Tax=Spirodela intermedia TaxID=51605 RepID=A0A7I8IBR6_SPIIN|nr:unnamed protein product [Spirodela intermedia]CAA6654773.1 unnamed protein product [Spirodela intermedia]